jgi:hypothetical protein
VVVTARMKQAIARMGGSAICRYRSPVLSACHAAIRTTIVPIKYGGVVRSKVVVLSLPRPDITLEEMVLVRH